MLSRQRIEGYFLANPSIGSLPGQLWDSRHHEKRLRVLVDDLVRIINPDVPSQAMGAPNSKEWRPIRNQSFSWARRLRKSGAADNKKTCRYHEHTARTPEPRGGWKQRYPLSLESCSVDRCLMVRQTEKGEEVREYTLNYWPNDSLKRDRAVRSIHGHSVWKVEKRRNIDKKSRDYIWRWATGRQGACHIELQRWIQGKLEQVDCKYRWMKLTYGWKLGGVDRTGAQGTEYKKFDCHKCGIWFLSSVLSLMSLFA